MNLPLPPRRFRQAVSAALPVGRAPAPQT